MEYTYTNSTADHSLGEVDTPTNKYTPEMILLTIAMSGAVIKEVGKHHIGFLNEHGYQPLYELIKEITDELLLSEDEVYQRDFLTAKDKVDWFSKNHRSSMDWYFMDRARDMIRETLSDYKNPF